MIYVTSEPLGRHISLRDSNSNCGKTKRLTVGRVGGGVTDRHPWRGDEAWMRLRIKQYLARPGVCMYGRQVV